MKNNNNIYNTKEIESLKNISTLPTNDVIFHCLFGTKGNEKITAQPECQCRRSIAEAAGRTLWP